MIDALISGRLHGAPVSRTASNGNRFATAKLRASTADGDAHFVNVIAFEESVVRALLVLEAGDSTAIAGELSVKTYTDREGNARPSLDLKAHAVLSEYHIVRKRRAVREAGGSEDELPDVVPAVGGSRGG
jgi:single-stranded DNA-binding protein